MMGFLVVGLHSHTSGLGQRPGGIRPPGDSLQASDVMAGLKVPLEAISWRTYRYCGSRPIWRSATRFWADYWHVSPSIWRSVAQWWVLSPSPSSWGFFSLWAPSQKPQCAWKTIAPNLMRVRSYLWRVGGDGV